MKLKSLGYYTYNQITGYFGPVTKIAVVRFQRAKGLSPYPRFLSAQVQEEN